MLAKESLGASFDLPQQVLEVLPSDPFQQLDVARKITSLALSTRVSALESESSDLRQQLTERDAFIADLHSQLDSLDSSLSQNLDRLSIADQEKENLVTENASLLETVNKLKRDVAKLESFRKTLMMSLQDEEGSSTTGPPVAADNVQNHSSLSSSQTFSGEDEETMPPSSMKSQASNIANSYNEEPMKEGSRAPPRISASLLLASERSTPPGSPPSLSASASPTRTPKPLSPRRHSISVTSTRAFDDKSSVFSSTNSTPYASMSGRTRVDGKEFFRQVRSRLSYEQFASFLANVKELNSQKQSKEETLRKADEIFGPDNKDLYVILEGLITRNFH